MTAGLAIPMHQHNCDLARTGMPSQKYQEGIKIMRNQFITELIDISCEWGTKLSNQ
jgi:hypothetical protein